MKLEDVRSGQVECGVIDRRRLNSQANQGESLVKVDIRELYILQKQVSHAIYSVESENKPFASINFLGTQWKLEVIGAEFPEKSEILNFFSQYSCLPNPQSPTFNLLPKEVLNSFCETFENSIKNQYFDYLFTTEIKQSRTIKEKKTFDHKSWALLQANYKKLKNYNENCENISKTLDWQKAEIQILKAELNSKLQIALKKEGELNFRQEELNKHQQELQESLKSFENKQQSLLTEKVSLESYKKRLDNMKAAIKAQLEELNKNCFLNLSQKTTSCTSRVSDGKQMFVNRLKSTSTFNSDKGDSEAEFSQIEIQTIENTSIEPIRPVGANNRFDFERVGNGCQQKKFTLPPKLAFLSPQAGRNEMFLNLPNRELFPDRSSTARTELKSPTASSSISQSEILTLREERLQEREAELDKREKEIQKNWLKNPNAQEFIPMIQSEMVRLKTLQREYDKKVKILQDRINKSENFEEQFNKRFSKNNNYSAQNSEVKDYSSLVSDEESLILSSRVEKLKDLYSMMEELV